MKVTPHYQDTTQPLFKKLTIPQVVKINYRLLWNTKVHYLIYNSPPLDPPEKDTVFILTPRYFELHLNFELPPYSKRSLTLGFRQLWTTPIYIMHATYLALLATARKSGDRILVGGNFPAPVQTSLRTNPAPYTISNGFLSRGKSGQEWRWPPTSI